MSSKFTYHTDVKAAHILLLSNDVAKSEALSPSVVFDFDAEGHIVGIELLNARNQLKQEVLNGAA
jgi:uncharacterized protein YuzE